jgi:hypothetical protein
MLRFLFWLLVAANAGLAAFQMGWLGHWTLDTREPERLKQQHHVNLLKQVAASAATSPAADSADADAAKTEGEGEKKLMPKLMLNRTLNRTRRQMLSPKPKPRKSLNRLPVWKSAIFSKLIWQRWKRNYARLVLATARVV